MRQWQGVLLGSRVHSPSSQVSCSRALAQCTPSRAQMESHSWFGCSRDIISSSRSGQVQAKWDVLWQGKWGGLVWLLIRTKCMFCFLKKLHLAKLKVKHRHHGCLEWMVPAHTISHSPANSYLRQQSLFLLCNCAAPLSTFYSLPVALGKAAIFWHLNRYPPVLPAAGHLLPHCLSGWHPGTGIKGKDHCSCTDMLYYIHNILKASQSIRLMLLGPEVDIYAL